MIERAARAAAPAAVALFVVIGVVLADSSVVTTASAVAGVVLVTALAALRVSGWALVVGLVAAVGLVSVVCSGEPANLGWFAICVLAGWAALVEPIARAIVVGGVAFAAVVAQWLLLAEEPGWGAWIAGTAFTVVCCAAARNQRLLLDQLREAQAGLAARAASEERNRIAHELHDVIGHALTVSLLHVTSARLALAEDPAEAEASLAEAERLGRESLAEVRAVVGLMRDTASSAPLPGVGELDDLVASFRRAGAEVDWHVGGDLSTLTATEGLTVYRILQEALTNVVRHAPGSPVVASVELGSGTTRLVVDSAGAPARVVGEGSGLCGMRERAEALGGAMSAGPSGTGWRVEAVLPS